MKKSTLSILILSSLLLAGPKADGFFGDDEPSPLLENFCEDAMKGDPTNLDRCKKSKASSESIGRCLRYDLDKAGNQIYVECLEADSHHQVWKCGKTFRSTEDRAQCIRLTKGLKLDFHNFLLCEKLGAPMKCISKIAQSARARTQAQAQAQACKDAVGGSDEAKCIEIVRGSSLTPQDITSCEKGNFLDSYILNCIEEKIK